MHPFAPYVKAVGAGQKRARALSREEARTAMALVLRGQVEPVQVGGFLLGLRMKGETAGEMAGFVDALHAEIRPVHAAPLALDIDGHGDGHLGRPSLLPAAAAAVSALGVPVLLRVELASPFAKHGMPQALEALGLDRSAPLDIARATRALSGGQLAVLDLQDYAPALKRLVDLRPLLGVRTVGQTLMKLLDPLQASARLVGVFHAPYLVATAEAMALVAPSRGVCVQALGGLPEPLLGKRLRHCYADQLEPASLDWREAGSEGGNPAPSLAPPEAETNPAATDFGALAVRANCAALERTEPFFSQAVASAALLLHAARGTSVAESNRAAREGFARLDDRPYSRA
jgi:anthranilate phosphoribosyltransferase